jgi:hypothetical protein
VYLFTTRQGPSREAWHLRFDAGRFAECQKADFIAHEEIKDAAQEGWVCGLRLQFVDRKACLGEKCAQKVVVCSDMGEGLKRNRFSDLGGQGCVHFLFETKYL